MVLELRLGVELFGWRRGHDGGRRRRGAGADSGHDDARDDDAQKLWHEDRIPLKAADGESAHGPQLIDWATGRNATSFFSTDRVGRIDPRAPAGGANQLAALRVCLARRIEQLPGKHALEHHFHARDPQFASLPSFIGLLKLAIIRLLIGSDLVRNRWAPGRILFSLTLSIRYATCLGGI